MTIRSEKRNLIHLDHLHFFLTAEEQIILQGSSGVVSRPQIDPNGSNKPFQQTIGRQNKNNEI